jgi:hypothetical protein
MNLAFWVQIAIMVTPLIYLGQLVVLILIYFRVIKETNRNAAERQQAIEKAGERGLAQAEYVKRQMHEQNRRNTIVLSIMSAGLAALLFASPHGFEIVLTDVATLSQAHLIQPGRALGGRTPGKSLLSRVLTATRATSCRTEIIHAQGLGRRRRQGWCSPYQA